ncbi:MAG: hypothetical protein M3P06_11090 [Acidobacteriota bacterium]|nr:hypothetical protein [Acidobacteriota bacterium]
MIVLDTNIIIHFWTDTAADDCEFVALARGFNVPLITIDRKSCGRFQGSRGRCALLDALPAHLGGGTPAFHSGPTLAIRKAVTSPRFGVRWPQPPLLYVRALR